MKQDSWTIIKMTTPKIYKFLSVFISKKQSLTNVKKRENGIKYWGFAEFFENIGINEAKKQMIIPTYFNQFEISIFISLKSKYKNKVYKKSSTNKTSINNTFFNVELKNIN